MYKGSRVAVIFVVHDDESRSEKKKIKAVAIIKKEKKGSPHQQEQTAAAGCLFRSKVSPSSVNQVSLLFYFFLCGTLLGQDRVDWSSRWTMRTDVLFI